jgi:hypothetical protein
MPHPLEKKMTDFDYRKYSLEQLENWIHDSMSCGESTPKEIYDVIVGAVKDTYYTYKHQASQAYELLALLNGNGQSFLKDVLEEREYYEGWDSPSEMSGTGAMQYTEAELNAMCDKAASDEEKEKCREYNLREAEYYNKRAELDAKKDKVTKWVLPVQVDGLTGDCFVNFPDDLLEQAGLKEGDTVEWITRDDGIIEMRKVTKPLQMDEC